MGDNQTNSGAETGGTPARFGAVALFAGIGIALWLSFLLARPFLSPLAWALALAIAMLPLHERVLIRVRRVNPAAAISTLLVAFFITGAVMIVAQRLASEATKGIETLQTEIQAGRWKKIVEQRPRVASIMRRAGFEMDLSAPLQQAATWLSTKAASLVTGGAWGVVELLLTFFFLFYLFRDHDQALAALKRLLPLSEREAQGLFTSVTDMIAATVYGTVAVSVVQGVLGGLMFWWLGLPAPLLWGVIMGLLGIVPILGAFVVWVPAAILLALEGHWMKALILTAWGGLVVSLIDNILYPILIGRRSQVHTLLVFLAIGGGLFLFGAAGLVLGPLILSVTLGLLDVWQQRSAQNAV
ncbi:MAG TPA: AI-2E family transporter [Methylomirabilota bacterium]|nr:AI-2E family transporter [Methylomirabilota bacterium]